MASTERDKRLRAELAQELGFYPASPDPADIDRHRRLNAALDRAPTLDRIHRKFAHTYGRKTAAHPSKPVAVPRWPTCTSDPWCQRARTFLFLCSVPLLA